VERGHSDDPRAAAALRRLTARLQQKKGDVFDTATKSADDVEARVHGKHNGSVTRITSAQPTPCRVNERDCSSIRCSLRSASYRMLLVFVSRAARLTAFSETGASSP